MRRTSLGLFAAGMALSAGSMFVSADARACGACFLPTNGESTVVTGHRMALSVSSARTVLWDQIQYQGSPEEFAWVLPVKGGTTIELASDAFFEALDAATGTRVTSPQLNIMCGATPGTEDEYYDYGYATGCSLAGCGSSGSRTDFRPGIAGTDGHPVGPPIVPPVEIVHEESIGPYEAVVLSSNKPGALYDWLDSHGYAVDPSMEPVVDSYEADGFDFVALRLIPGVDVRQMRPVRVISPGASPVLPLRMVAAGTGANVALTLFVIGEGRWEAQNFPNGQVAQGEIEWDFATSSSNYATLKQTALAASDGWTWLTTYSKPGTLLQSQFDSLTGGTLFYQASDGSGASTIADLYFTQGKLNGERLTGFCGSPSAYANVQDKVVALCDPAEETGGGGAGGAMSTGGVGGTGGVGTGGVGTGGVGTGGVGGNTGAGGGAGGVGGTGGVGTGGVGGNTGAGGGTGGVAGMMGAGGGGAGGGFGSACAHDPCATGDPLGQACDPCVDFICSYDAYCCASGWDQICAEEVAGVCGIACESACAEVPGPGEIDSRVFACGEMQDLEVALVGMHPSSVWVTRLEANLPRSALGQDLALTPSLDQGWLENRVQTVSYTGDPCAGAAAPVSPPGRARGEEPRNKSPFGSPDLLAVGLTLATLLGAAARRLLRKTVRIPA